ncbi:apolipoprotein L3-like [Carassius auratus]|uniref:Apolipoprotein L3-like n=1 Tax=Carassius auratus TaxID=7957 RepID=A0A6P6IYM5_CARAU|nr:apolipoprotein L3-like [Carassius auratus]
MDRRRNLSGSSDYSRASDWSIDPPPYFNCAGSKPEEILHWKLQTFDTFKRTIEELKSEYDRNLPTLTDQIKKLNDIADQTESVHKGTEVGNLVGASVGAFGGIAELAGMALAPITSRLAMSLSAVGAVAEAAGRVTSTASNITNKFKQRKLRLTVEKIICDFLEILKPMTEHLSIISYITADVQRNNEMLSKLRFQRPVRGFDDLLKIVRVADVAIVGNYCAEAAKEICVYENNVSAVRGSAGAAKAKRVAATTGVISSLFLTLDVASIVQDLIEISEMNQPAKERKAEEIKSQTLKFIHYTRETASQFQETLDKINLVINTFN